MLYWYDACQLIGPVMCGKDTYTDTHTRTYWLGFSRSRDINIVLFWSLMLFCQHSFLLHQATVILSDLEHISSSFVAVHLLYVFWLD